MEIQLVYDSTFKRQFGESKVKKHLDAIGNYINTFFKHSSLETRLDVVSVGKYIYAGDVTEKKR